MKGRTRALYKGTGSSLNEYSKLKRSDSDLKIIRKELHPFFRLLLFGAYTYACLHVGVFLNTEKINELELNELKYSMERLKDSVESNMGKTIIQTSSLDKDKVKFQIKELNKIKRDLASYVSIERLNQEKVIGKQKNEISRLKNQVAAIKKLHKYESKDPLPKVMTYSSTNWQILYDSHQIKLNRLRQKQKQIEKTFLVANDLSTAGGMQKYEEFKDKQELEYKALKRRLQAQRRDLMNKKVLVRNNN